MLDMDTNTDAMSSTLLHMRHQLNDSNRQINILTEENTRLKTLCQSTTTPNGTTHTDSSTIVSTTTNTNNNNNNTKLPQKRPYPSNRTTQNVPTPNKVKTTTNLYDVDETTSPPPPAPSSSNEMMDTESNTLTSTSMNSTNNNNNINNNNTNQHHKRTNPIENGINVTP